MIHRIKLREQSGWRVRSRWLDRWAPPEPLGANFDNQIALSLLQLSPLCALRSMIYDIRGIVVVIDLAVACFT
jgi:hypothetical protein